MDWMRSGIPLILGAIVAPAWGQSNLRFQASPAVATAAAQDAPPAFEPAPFPESNPVPQTAPARAPRPPRPAPAPPARPLAPPLEEAPLPEDLGPLPERAGAQPPIEAPELIAPPAAERLPEPVKADEYTLEQFEAIALGSNPSLARAAAQIEAARGDWVQAGLLPNPEIGYMGQEMGADGTAGQQGALVGQKFLLAPKLRLARAEAAQKIRMAESRYRAQEGRVRNDVRTRFNDALVAQRRVALSLELVRIAGEAVRAGEALVKAGQSAKVDLIQAQIEAENANLAVDNARQEQLSAWRRLAAVAGQPDWPLGTLCGEIETDAPALSWEECLARLYAMHPELAAASADVERARWAIRLAKANVVPDVDVQVGVMHDNAAHEEMAQVQAMLPLPLFNRNQGNIRRATAELTAAGADMRRLELNLRDRLASAYRDHAYAAQQVARYQGSILPKAQESLELVRKGYLAGQVDFVTVLTAQRTYFQAQLALLDALRQRREAGVALEGQLLTGSLEEPR